MKSSPEEILKFLTEVKDPEIPVLNVVEMGIVRGAAFEGETLRIDITPTYSGCPALQVIADDIVAALKARGFERVRVNTVYAPAWTTDWLSAESKAKLKAFGIAPPAAAAEDTLVSLGKKKPVQCPYCGATKTELRSEFSSTACKSMHYCVACQQPFEHFKPF